MPFRFSTVLALVLAAASIHAMPASISRRAKYMPMMARLERADWSISIPSLEKLMLRNRPSEPAEGV